MHFTTVFAAALSGLVASVAASPVDLQTRQAPAAGTAIFKCKVANTIAITFDDGPFDYTASALDQLKAAGMRATFFVNGDNFASIRKYEPEVKRMIAEGHQVGSHTWSHRYMTQIDNTYMRWQMTKLETELLRIIGRRPTYMRPPYFDYNDNVLKIMKEMSYQVVIADVDTNDWDFNLTYAQVWANFINGLNAGGRLVLTHDIHARTIEQLLPAMIAEIKRRGLKAVPVGECLGDPAANWYKTTARA